MPYNRTFTTGQRVPDPRFRHLFQWTLAVALSSASLLLAVDAAYSVTFEQVIKPDTAQLVCRETIDYSYTMGAGTSWQQPLDCPGPCPFDQIVANAPRWSSAGHFSDGCSATSQKCGVSVRTNDSASLLTCKGVAGLGANCMRSSSNGCNYLAVVTTEFKDYYTGYSWNVSCLGPEKGVCTWWTDPQCTSLAPDSSPPQKDGGLVCPETHYNSSRPSWCMEAMEQMTWRMSSKCWSSTPAPLVACNAPLPPAPTKAKRCGPTGEPGNVVRLMDHVRYIAARSTHHFAVLAKDVEGTKVRYWTDHIMTIPTSLQSEADNIVQMDRSKISWPVVLFANGTVAVWDANQVLLQSHVDVADISSGREYSQILYRNGTMASLFSSDPFTAAPAGNSYVQVEGGLHDEHGRRPNLAMWALDSTGTLWASDTAFAGGEGQGSVAKIAAGDNHVVVLLRNGTVRVWVDTHADLHFAPDPFAQLDPSLKAKDIAAGSNFSLALLEDGTVRCWGPGFACDPDPPLTNVVQIAAGDEHMMALAVNGTVFGWATTQAGHSAFNYPSSQTPVCVKSCTNQGRYFLVRAVGLNDIYGIVRCLGPNNAACSWYLDDKCTHLAPGEMGPAEDSQYWGMSYGATRDGWCKAAVDAVFHGIFRTNCSVPLTTTATVGGSATTGLSPSSTIPSGTITSFTVTLSFNLVLCSFLFLLLM